MDETDDNVVADEEKEADAVVEEEDAFWEEDDVADADCGYNEQWHALQNRKRGKQEFKSDR